MSSNRIGKRTQKMSESGQSQKKRKSGGTTPDNSVACDGLLNVDESIFAVINVDNIEQAYWNNHSTNNSNKVASTKNKTPLASEKKKKNFSFGKRKRPVLSLRHKQEPDPTELASDSDSEHYEIESVHTDSLKSSSIAMARPVTCITPTSNNTPSRAQNSRGTKAHLKQLKINESGVKMFSSWSESENNSFSEETRENQPQNNQTAKKGALDDAIPLSFDVNAYIWIENLTQMYQASQNKNIEFILDKSDSLNESPPGEVIVLKDDDIDIRSFSEEFQSSNHEWDQDNNVTEPKQVQELDVFSEGCHDDLTQFYESSQVLRQIEDVINTCESVNDSENCMDNTDHVSVINSKENETAKDHTSAKSNSTNVVLQPIESTSSNPSHAVPSTSKVPTKNPNESTSSNMNSPRAVPCTSKVPTKNPNESTSSNINPSPAVPSTSKFPTKNPSESPSSNRNSPRAVPSTSNTPIKNLNDSTSSNMNPPPAVPSTSKAPTKNPVSVEIKKAITNIREQDDNWDEAIASGISQLFKSTQYKREVAGVFDNLETSICQISAGQDISLQKDTLSNQTIINNTLNSINWPNDSIVSFDPNISSLIKRALLNNAHGVQSVNCSHVKTQVDTDFTEIGPFYGLPLKVKDLIKQYKGIDSLYDWQDECLKLEAIRKRKNLVYALPTSGGKTLVSEILILREIMCRKHNVLFVLPYVSIVQEKVWALSPFALALDFLVEEYAAGKGGYPPRKRRHKHSVYIATIEKGLGLINSLMETDRLKEIGLVVVDELHLVGEQGRGVNLETLLTKLMYAKESIHIVGMSATIGNLPEVCKFLKAEVYTKDFRPVELKEYVKCEKQIYEVNRKAKTIEECLVRSRTIDFQYSENVSTMDPDRLTGLVMEVVPSGSCLVFCPSKKNCENVATLLCRIMFRTILEHKKTEKEDLLKLIQAEGSLCPILKRTIPFGVAYHHSGLTSDERRLIEDAFRVGTLCVICCTSTLAAGVNLPAKRVLLRSPYVGRDFISLARYKQMVGRAGRAGLGEIGESILVCDKRDLKKVAELLCSPMDQVESKMCENDLKGLRDLVLSCIALGTAQTRRTLRQVTSCTLLAVQEERLEQNVKRSTDRAISDLFKLGALQLDSDKSTVPDTNITVFLQSSLVGTPESSQNKTPSDRKKVVVGNDSKLVISKLGKAAIKGGLSLDTAHILYEDLVQAQASLVLLSCLHLLYLVTPYDLARQIKPSLPNYYSIYVELTIKELQTAKVLGLNEACEAGLLTGRRIKTVNERVLNRFYLTLMLYDLWNEKPVFEVAQKYQVSRGIVQQLMVSAATFASNVMRFCEELDEFWAFTDLLKGMSQRLQHCSSRELLPLMDLPSVKQGRARQLYRAGYKSLQNIARANPNDLMNNIDHMSRRIANQLIASAKLLLLERVENLREEAEDVLEGIEVPQNDF